MTPRLILQAGRESSLQRRHPWIFSGAVARLEGEVAPGATVDVYTASGKWLARAACSPASQIRARVWTFDAGEAVDAAFFRRRLRAAMAARGALLPAADAARSAVRLVHAESDGLPGFIVDRYADTLVVQFLTAGAEYWRETFVNLLLEESGLQRVWERSDAEVRALEGLPARRGVLHGDPPERLVICENGLYFTVDIAQGHKTGFYLDQRENRARLGALAREREVLDCFCYTGGFTVHALAGGARSVLAIDSSPEALALCQENVRRNHLPVERLTLQEGDVFHVLRSLRDQNRSFDLIILDPPKFAPTAAQAGKAARGYKDINLLAFKLLRPGGLLATFSCSGGVDAALFQKIVASAALDAGVEAIILARLHQAADHPVALHFPEGAYLKGLLCLKR